APSLQRPLERLLGQVFRVGTGSEAIGEEGVDRPHVLVVDGGEVGAGVGCDQRSLAQSSSESAPISPVASDPLSNRGWIGGSCSPTPSSSVWGHTLTAAR